MGVVGGVGFGVVGCLLLFCLHVFVFSAEVVGGGVWYFFLFFGSGR